MAARTRTRAPHGKARDRDRSRTWALRPRARGARGQGTGGKRDTGPRSGTRRQGAAARGAALGGRRDARRQTGGTAHPQASREGAAPKTLAVARDAEDGRGERRRTRQSRRPPAGDQTPRARRTAGAGPATPARRDRGSEPATSGPHRTKALHWAVGLHGRFRSRDGVGPWESTWPLARVNEAERAGPRPGRTADSARPAGGSGWGKKCARLRRATA